MTYDEQFVYENWGWISRSIATSYLTSNQDMVLSMLSEGKTTEEIARLDKNWSVSKIENIKARGMKIIILKLNTSSDSNSKRMRTPGSRY